MILLRKLGDAFDAVMGLVEMVRSFDAVMGVAQNLEAEARLLRERVPLLEADLEAARAALEKTLGRVRQLEDRRRFDEEVYRTASIRVRDLEEEVTHLRLDEAHTQQLACTFARERDEARLRVEELERQRAQAAELLDSAARRVEDLSGKLDRFDR